MTETITVTLDGVTYTDIPKGICLSTLVEHLFPGEDHPILGAFFQGRLQGLDTCLTRNTTLTWVKADSEMGWRIYRRSTVFLLLLAVKELFPQDDLFVSHSLSEGLYCRFVSRKVQPEHIPALIKVMKRLVKEDIPFVKQEIPAEQAAAFLKEIDNLPMAEVLEQKAKGESSLFYTAKNITKYCFGPLVPSTGWLTNFHLEFFQAGIWLKLPYRRYLGCAPMNQVPVHHLQRAMADFDEWSRLMGVETIADLNRVVRSNQEELIQLILISETFYDRHIRDVADAVTKDLPTARLLLLAGPSSSGKTTSTERLGVHFRTLGVKPVRLSMDDYFLDREKTPLTPEGKPDFECLQALNLDLFQENMRDLLSGKETSLPRFDFKEGKSILDSRRLRLGEDQVLIVEGIHALNEEVSQHLPEKCIRRIFVSALTQLNYDRYTPVSASDCRMIRRMARDMQFRGIEPKNTLLSWDAVRRGEHMNIFPWQDRADFFVNSCLLYEMCVLRSLVEAPLAAITPEEECYPKAKQALALVQSFAPADASLVPRNSILQEFLGNSLFSV